MRIFDPFMQVLQVKSLADGIFPVRKPVRPWKSATRNAAVYLLAGDTAKPYSKTDRDEGIALDHKSGSDLSLKILFYAFSG